MNKKEAIDSNKRKLFIIKKILTDYINTYKNVYCHIKRVEEIDFELAMNIEYDSKINHENEEYKLVNLYFVKRALKAIELLKTVNEMIVKVQLDAEYAETSFVDDINYFIYRNDNYQDIMKEYAFSKYFINHYNKMDNDRKAILDEFLYEDDQKVYQKKYVN